jgi:hypothetical protein
LERHLKRGSVFISLKDEQVYMVGDKNGDISKMMHILLSGEQEAIRRLADFQRKATANTFKA